MPAGGAPTVAVVTIADIALILLMAVIFTRLAARLRQPPVIGELVAGIVLGPSLLGVLPGHLTTWLFPPGAQAYLSLIAQVGLLLFMFGVGWELDMATLRYRGRGVAAIALASMTLPFALGLALAPWLYQGHSSVRGHLVPFTSFALYIGIIMSITAFPVLARIVSDFRLQHARSGIISLGSAALADVLAWCVLAVVVATVQATGAGGFAATIGYSAVYVAVMTALVRPGLRWLIPRLSRGPARVQLALLVSAGVFLSSFATSLIGLHGIFGAFAFGLVMPRSGPLREVVAEPLAQASSLLLPVFFTVTGLSVDVAAMNWTELAALGLVLVAACAGKLLGGGLTARACGLSWNESAVVGVLMNTRGATELVILSIGVSLGVLDGGMFTVMVLMALVTTAMAGLLLPRPSPSSPYPATPASEPASTSLPL